MAANRKVVNKVITQLLKMDLTTDKGRAHLETVLEVYGGYADIEKAFDTWMYADTPERKAEALRDTAHIRRSLLERE